MEPVTRRTALILGGLGATAVVAGAGGLLWSQLNPFELRMPDGSGADLREPDVHRSAAGVLDVALTAAASTKTIGGRAARVLAYNGTLPGPTLAVRPGDELRIEFANQLSATTNLHTHGLHVSPDGESDNVFRRIDAGESARYRIQIPADHPPGTHWYHPHHHGTAAEQVFAGLYGAILVDDPEARDSLTERLLVISDISLAGSGDVRSASVAERMLGREGDLVLVNGQLAPVIRGRPGEQQRWRIVNACTSRYLDLRLDGQRFDVLGYDSARLERPREAEALLLLPGNRVDVLVTMAEGRSVLTAIPTDRGSFGMMGGVTRSTEPVAVATVAVDGDAVDTPPVTFAASTARDLRRTAVDRTRTLVLAMGGGMMGGGMTAFTIDGASFDPDRIDQDVALGSVEEWQLVNSSTMDHPFHLHVWPMQVVSVGGVDAADVIWRDVVDVPARSTTTVRIAFGDIAGTTVYHCHILDHEDAGIMGVIRVGG